MGLRQIKITTKTTSQHPYIVGTLLSIILFLIWEISDYIVFDYLAQNFFVGYSEILAILRGFANAVVITLIIVGFSITLSKFELVQKENQINVLNKMHDGLIEVNRHNVILFANDQIKKLLFLPDDFEIDGQTINFLLPENQQIVEITDLITKYNLDMKATDSLLQKREILIKSWTGELIPVLLSMQYLKERDVYLLVFTDIKDLKNAQDQIQYLMHIEKVSALGHLVLGIGHEINNPLSYLINDMDSLDTYIKEMIQYIDESNEIITYLINNTKNIEVSNELQTKLDNIQNFLEKFNGIKGEINDIVTSQNDGLHRIAKVVKDLRKYSSVGTQSKKSSYQINEIISLPLSLIREQISNRIDIVKTLEDGIPEAIINPERLTQALMNIILNSIQAIDNKGSIYIHTFYEVESSKICIEISDTGKGIEAENLEKIFNPYFTTKPEGTGLGLSIVKNIIDELNGTIEVSSELNKGTKFLIKLPKSPDKPQEIDHLLQPSITNKIDEK